MNLELENLTIGTGGYSYKDKMITKHYVISDLIPYRAKTMSALANETVKPKEQISYDIIKPKDVEEVLGLLRKNFFKDEPINDYLQLGECVELEQYATKSIPEKLSVKAVNSKGEIIGVFLNAIMNRPGPDYVCGGSADNCEHPKFKKVLELMDYIETQFNIFDLYPNYNQLLDGKIISVSGDYRGFGIAGALTEKTMECMKQQNIPVLHVLCSSYFSARVMEKLGFREVYSLAYSDFKINGVNSLSPKAPHKHVKILVKEVLDN